MALRFDDTWVEDKFDDALANPRQNPFHPLDKQVLKQIQAHVKKGERSIYMPPLATRDRLHAKRIATALDGRGWLERTRDATAQTLARNESEHVHDLLSNASGAKMVAEKGTPVALKSSVGPAFWHSIYAATHTKPV